LRRRNHVRPQQIPYKAASGMTYDSGDFGALFEKALKYSEGFEKRRAESKSNGKLRGLGLGSYLEVTAPPNKEMAGIRFETEGADAGAITLVSGTLDYGQGHAAPFAQVLSTRLGVPFEKIRLVQNDSDRLVFGAGTGGSRSAMMGGGAIAQASDLIVTKGKALAAEALEAAAADIEFPNSCHVCEVEIDPDTGVVEVVRYNSVNDFGTVLNPLMVEGQIHGGVVQGMGQCFMESARYDEDAQLL